MEVLMAVFVLTVGLMGIAMVIPAGQTLMVEASKNDRGTACGRAGLNEVQIRRWQDSSRWVHKWNMSVGATDVTAARVGGGLLYGETYFIDPVFFGYDYPNTPTDRTDDNATIESVRHFPYSAYPWKEFSFWGSNRRQWPDRALARRISFANPGSNINLPPVPPITEAVAARITTWADELIFSLENDGGRPRQSFIWTDGQGWAAPTLPADQATKAATDYALHPADEGRFTWSVMINPIVPAAYQGTVSVGAGVPALPLTNPIGVSQYEISIVVFYNRNFYCPTEDELKTPADSEGLHERSVYARLDGGGIGGGEVLLFVENGDAARPAGYLDVRKNNWIMLKGLDRSRWVGSTTAPLVMVTCPTVCKWYRVVAVDDEQTGISMIRPTVDLLTPVDASQTMTGHGRYVTLAGPDWQLDTTAPDGFFTQSDIAEAALVDDVIGVYTTILDVNAL